MYVPSLSSFTWDPERSPSSYNKHQDMQQLLYVQWRDHPKDALCRIHRRKSGCMSGWVHVVKIASFFLRVLLKMYTLLFHLFKVVMNDFCVYLIRGTAGVLLFVRMNICGGWQGLWVGGQAALSRIILGFTPKWLNSWTGSMIWSRYTFNYDRWDIIIPSKYSYRCEFTQVYLIGIHCMLKNNS